MQKIGGKVRRSGALVHRVRDGVPQYLLVSSSSDPNRYVLPAGHIERDEHPMATAVREVWEESGARIRICRYAGRYTHRKKSGRKRPTHVFLASLVAQQCSPESREIRWCRVNDLQSPGLGIQAELRDFIGGVNAGLSLAAAA